MPEFWRRTQKYNQLVEWEDLSSIDWNALQPDTRGTWLSEGHREDFANFPPLGSKRNGAVESIFSLFSNGPMSNNDVYVCNFHANQLKQQAEVMTKAYNSELSRWQSEGRPKDITNFLKVEPEKIKWIRRAKRFLAAAKPIASPTEEIRPSLYRPFCKQFRNLSPVFNEDLYRTMVIFPATDTTNPLISINQGDSIGGFFALAALVPIDRHFTGDAQAFPLFTYPRGGGMRRENITQWSITKYRSHFQDATIGASDIFHSTYAVLYHPEYRTHYAANLKRELPRIPFPPDFHAFASAGQRLMELHIDYEKQKQYPLEQIEDAKAEVTFRVERMKLSKDKSELRYNSFLTLRGIPAVAFDYRLGNRSALEWVIDQYRVSIDPRSGIVNDPNREDDPQYILRLIGQVITVSLETQRIIAALPSLNLGKDQ